MTNNIDNTVEQSEKQAASVLSAVGSVTRWLGIAVVLFGHAVLPTDLGTVLAAGAIVLWASTYFELQALRDQHGTGIAGRVRAQFADRDGSE